MRDGLDDIVGDCVRTACEQGRGTLLEPEALRIVEALGLGVPHHVVVTDESELDRLDWSAFGSDRIVVKVLSPRILHKSDVGGVEVVDRTSRDVGACICRMRDRFAADASVVGFGLFEFVRHDTAPGGELLLGMRWTDDFGPVVTLGLGGIRAEALAGPPGGPLAPILLSAADRDEASLADLLSRRTVAALPTRPFRGQPPRLERDALERLLDAFLEFAARHVPERIAELEVNPVVFGERGPVALDALVRLGPTAVETRPARPLAKIAHLLEPRSVAVLGVSERRNPGHIIVENMLAEGFPREQVFVVKPGQTSIMGCACVPDVESLPGTVDLCILSIDATQVPETLHRISAGRKAESLIVIPGGLGERSGTAHLVREIHDAIDEARAEDWAGPVLNGGNCLGVRSLPGRFDTTFVPRHKISATPATQAPLALISQSGAFTVSKTSKWAGLDPRYSISVGNQLDLTVGDYLTWLAGDASVKVFACYVEGFRPLDGLAWLRAARRITESGRTVVLYRGGRTPDGARAGVSHTAAVAGDYAVTRELAEQAGVLVAETLSDFEDLVTISCRLDGRAVGGRRLGALTNAGFECVAMADNLAGFRLAEYGPATRSSLKELFERTRLDRIVEIQNPLDTTPIMGDEPSEQAVRAILADPGVDVGIVGCVPHTGALETLAAAEGHAEDVSRESSVAQRLVRLFAETDKAWVAVVDAGPLYDPLALALETGGVPVFRTADRALRLFDRYCAARLRSKPGDGA